MNKSIMNKDPVDRQSVLQKLLADKKKLMLSQVEERTGTREEDTSRESRHTEETVVRRKGDQNIISENPSVISSRDVRMTKTNYSI
jgi:hypothetical protein